MRTDETAGQGKARRSGRSRRENAVDRDRRLFACHRLSPEEVPGLLREVRGSLGLTNEEVARRYDRVIAKEKGRRPTTHNSISKWLGENDGKPLGFEKADRLCQAMGLDMEDLASVRDGADPRTTRLERVRREALKILRVYFALGQAGRKILLDTGTSLLNSGQTFMREGLLEDLRRGWIDQEDAWQICKDDRFRPLIPDDPRPLLPDLDCPSDSSPIYGEWLARRALGEDEPHVDESSWERESSRIRGGRRGRQGR